MKDFDVIIPFRDRGIDWRRSANLKASLQWWRSRGIEPIVVDDGFSGDEQFNRSRAYNRGAGISKAEILCYIEADLLVPANQLYDAIRMAAERPGLVVPFSRFMAMIERDTEFVRAGLIPPAQACAQQMRGDNQSIGAANVVTRESLGMVGGFDEGFAGHAYDDDATELAFRLCCGPTRFVAGASYHMHHLPGALYGQASEADLAATERNRQRFELYKQAKTPEDIRRLTLGNID